MAKKIVIDAGHGGVDSGAVANSIIEKDLTLKISKYIKKRLDELGIENSITRDDDSTLNPSERVDKALSFYGNDRDVIVLSNHINAGGGDGAEVIYALRGNDTLPMKILMELESAGQNVRRAYQKTLPNDSSKDYYYMLRNTPNTESIIVEYGFLDSKNLDEVEMLKNKWMDLAESVVKALSSYVGVSYINEPAYYYTVQKGDTLWSIARKFNLSVDKLKDINKLKDNLLNIGQKLIVSEKAPLDINYYIVKKGDTLYSIAKKYNLSVSDLKKINNLDSDTLSIGMKLSIKSSPNIYVVQKGDSLYSISRKFNTTVSELADLNNLSSALIYVGQELIIP